MESNVTQDAPQGFLHLFTKSKGIIKMQTNLIP